MAESPAVNPGCRPLGPRQGAETDPEIDRPDRAERAARTLQLPDLGSPKIENRPLSPTDCKLDLGGRSHGLL